MRVIQRFLSLALISVAFLGCTQELEVPTVAPTIGFITQVPSLTPSPLPTKTPVPTATATTLPPTRTPVFAALEPTRLASPGVNITSPSTNQVLLQGHTFDIRGLVSIDAGQKLSIELVSASGYLLISEDIMLDAVNNWQVTIEVPRRVGGFAEVLATIRDQDGLIIAKDSRPIYLTVDPAENEVYLELYRPDNDTNAVAGYYLFFDGVANHPVNNTVSISAWDKDCQREISRQSYRLRGSGYWQGFLPIPADTLGKICAIARFGTPGEGDWREVQVLINVVSSNDEAATGITIGNPRAGSTILPARNLLLYGTAYNAQDNQILVSILLDNGRLLSENVTYIDFFGYWEIELYIPANASGTALIEASYGVRGTEGFVIDDIEVTIGSSD